MQLRNNVIRCRDVQILNAACQTYPHDNDNEHDANENHDGPLEPWLAVLWAETYLGQIAHEVAVPRELLAQSGAERMIAEGSVRDERSNNGTERKVCGRKIAVETNVFWYALRSRYDVISYDSPPITKANVC